MPLNGLAQLVTVGWRERFRMARAALLMALADFVLEAVPLGFFGILVFLTRISMLPAWAPILVPRGSILAPSTARACIVTPWPRSAPGAGTSLPIAAETWTFIVSIWAWPLPAPLALAQAGVPGLVSRVEELAPLKPFHDRRLVLFAQPVERWQQLFGVMGAEGGGLVVDENGPVRMTRRHSTQFYAAPGTGNWNPGARRQVS